MKKNLKTHIHIQNDYATLVVIAIALFYLFVSLCSYLESVLAYLSRFSYVHLLRVVGFLPINIPMDNNASLKVYIHLQ